MSDARAGSPGDPAEPVAVVLVTGPDEAALVEIGRTLVEEGLAACMNVLPGVRSIYRWEGSVRDEGEALGIVKTVRSRVPAVTRRIGELHPYELPEVLGLEAEGGSASYAAWVRDTVGRGGRDEPE